MFEDLKEKFQLKLMYLFAPFTALCVAPIAVYRYLHHEWITAVLDAAIVVAVLLTVLYVHLSKSVRTPSMVGAVLYTTGAVLASYVNSPLYIFWLYPAVLANFFLLHPLVALTMNLVALAAVVPVALQTSDPILTVGMMGSLLFSISMSFGFAQLTERQRLALRSAASHDSLTSVGNRRLMDSEIDRAIDRYERHPAPMSLILLDLDKFKNVNDRYGHRMGDQLLAAVANLLSTHTRNADRVFRYGGEEFVLLAENTPLDKAAIVAEHLRQQIDVRIHARELPFTASFGVAEFEPGETAEHWLGRADRAMYQAKENGRNCVVLAAKSEQETRQIKQGGLKADVS
mgnify:CR=1 FL=1